MSLFKIACSQNFKDWVAFQIELLAYKAEVY
jgi:hypothetical protein